MRLKQIINDKNIEIDDLMNRVGPGIPLSENLLNIFEGIKSFFEDKDENLPSDDEDEIDESNITDALNRVVNKDELSIKDDDNSSEMSEKEMYHLKILKDESDNEDSGEDNEKEEKNNGDNISFFD
jgi:hypothetical protein